MWKLLNFVYVRLEADQMSGGLYLLLDTVYITAPNIEGL